MQVAAQGRLGGVLGLSRAMEVMVPGNSATQRLLLELWRAQPSGRGAPAGNVFLPCHWRHHPANQGPGKPAGDNGTPCPGSLLLGLRGQSWSRPSM